MLMQYSRQRTTPRYLWATILIALLAITGCTLPPLATGTPSAPAENTPAATTEPAATTPAESGAETEGDPLAGSNWQLTTFGPTGAETPVVTDSVVTLAFSADGAAGGNTGCNSFGGEYTVEGDTLQLGELVSTLMACADETVMAQEQAYLQALQSAARFEVTPDQLTIWYDAGSSQLNFMSQPAGSQ